MAIFYATGRASGDASNPEDYMFSCNDCGCCGRVVSGTTFIHDCTPQTTYTLTASPKDDFDFDRVRAAEKQKERKEQYRGWRKDLRKKAGKL